MQTPIVRMSYRGRSGHPMLFTKALFGELKALHGDKGVWKLCDAHAERVYEVEVEIWPTCIVYPKGYSMALTIGGKDFERPGATGMMKGSGIFMHDSTADRPAPEFAGVNTIHTGGENASCLLLPLIRHL